MSRVFANGQADQGSKIQKIELDDTLLSTHDYKGKIKGKVGQS